MMYTSLVEKLGADSVPFIESLESTDPLYFSSGELIERHLLEFVRANAHAIGLDPTPA